MSAHFRFVFVVYTLLSGPAVGGDRADIIVAQDGSGNFTSIQSAINSLPRDNPHKTIILIRNGTYREKIFITRSNLVLVGEDRDSTRIVIAELRKNWVQEHRSDWGAAVVNIDSTVTDLTIANLTVHNNYGSLYGDNDHQFAIWGKGTRIILLYCNVVADGGDTVSLWNEKDGMYYHSNCYFEGWVDYVCPRGWCYITDSRFYGHNKTASLWHHGATDEDQKFVIRNSYFDGVPGFPLGRHHVDGQFYLLDCVFSKNMADAQIHYPDYSPNARPWKWGARHYYYNCRRDGGNYDWFKDNLAGAKGSPRPEQITAQWTFAGRWDPEKAMPAVLPFVSHPKPKNGSEKIDRNSVQLTWLPARNSKSHLIFLGVDSIPPLLSKSHRGIYKTAMLLPKTRYFWRVDSVTDKDTIKGPLWSFSTQ
jgi:pectinesterase